MDTAAVVRHSLDLFITFVTAARAPLEGSLGVPVWMALSTTPVGAGYSCATTIRGIRRCGSIVKEDHSTGVVGCVGGLKTNALFANWQAAVVLRHRRKLFGSSELEKDRAQGAKTQNRGPSRPGVGGAGSFETCLPAARSITCSCDRSSLRRSRTGELASASGSVNAHACSTAEPAQLLDFAVVPPPGA